ncbi:hypothetical protein [Flavobacterium sp.]|uniref:hypothetical protein n=1 Tax=Flavobacterium sp. TaxID=239 RepID=UPI00404884EE
MIKKKIPFNIIFAFLFLGCLLFNFCSKVYTYVVSEKYVGKIIGFSIYQPIYPIIEFVDKNNSIHVLKEKKWFYAFTDDQIKGYEKDLNKEVTILFNASNSSYEYVTFYNYWLTVTNLLTWFCILFFGVIIFELIQSIFFKN